MYETKMYRGTQIGESHTTVFADAELSTFNFALGYSVSWNSRCVWFGGGVCVCMKECSLDARCMSKCTRAYFVSGVDLRVFLTISE